MRLHIAKAEGVGVDTAGCIIEIDDAIPHHISTAEHDAWFLAQGRALADTLYRSLPGATVDTLLIHLLELTRSKLHVSYADRG
jgi:hypothetical protein